MALVAECGKCVSRVPRATLRDFGEKQLCPDCFAGVLDEAGATMRALLAQKDEPGRRCSGCAAMVDPSVGSQWCSILELGDTRAVLCANFVPLALRAEADGLDSSESLDPTQIWGLVCSDLENTLGPTHLGWLEGARPKSIEDGNLLVEVADEYTRAWLVARLMPAIMQVLEANGYANLAVEFAVGSPQPRRVTKAVAAGVRAGEPIPLQPVPTPPSAPYKPRPHQAGGFNPSYSFDQFVVGTGNRLAHAGALAVAEGTASTYNPLFLYGGVGVGKTHLLQAIGGKSTSLGRSALYVASETFTNELITSIRSGSTSDFRRRYREIDILLVDDIHFIIGKMSTQEEFFHTFNWLYDAGKQIVLSSDRSPSEMEILDDRLRSRFWSGLTADIQPPDVPTRIEILRRKAMLRGRSLPDDVLEFLGRRTAHNVRELEGLLNRLLALADLNGVEPSLSLAMGMLKGHSGMREIDQNDVLQAVSAYFRVTCAAMSGKQRSRDVSTPRHIAMYLMREDAKLSLPHIGDVLGGRDHSTVIYGWSRIDKEMACDGKVRRDVEAIRGLLFPG